MGQVAHFDGPASNGTAPLPKSEQEPASRRWTRTLADYITLTKPRITLMVVITAAMGMYVAPTAIHWLNAFIALTTIAITVAGANALNCYLERDSDRLMKRTQSRPLPDGRMAPQGALILGLTLGLGAIIVLALQVNILTAILGAIALGSYVLVYTPLKQYSAAALHIGSIPGALPPLMGWTAVTGSLDIGGLALFGVLFIWQVPHFIAIAIYRREDYANAGLHTVPGSRGHGYAKAQAVLYSAMLIPLALILFSHQVAGWYFLIVSLGLALLFIIYGLLGFRYATTEAPVSQKDADEEAAWAKRYFKVSLLYLTLFSLAIVLDAGA